MKPFSSFIQHLSKQLKKPLPAEMAHAVMEASSAAYLTVNPDEKTRRSAVLMLLYPIKDEVSFPLIVRPAYEGFHSGEVAFPGGRYELTDNDLIHTALREAQEEVGVKPNDVKILGTLTEIYIGPSNFLVLPVIGYIPFRPDFVPSDREVEAILESKLDHFCDPNLVRSSEIRIPGDRVVTPYYEVEGHKVWGATAKMIAELLMVLDVKRPLTNDV
ncbi:NUDIX hydrolase [Spirosoma foliorum]|uniref:CoA pyrophosphatase n=1 Tax=Spirosoma foliorum TaxID=2710596 RepID=A0A7G5H1F7_9BACT|nr:CoA pyrophosphatase [Spirosoma foliorum]QMW04949.1 CoA pyrophosphatase [Spirosoma foliorum]